MLGENENESQRDRQLGKFWMYGAIALVVLSIVLRFYNLGHKVYWIDETYTSLRISGYREAELVENLYNGQPFPASELQRYQYPTDQRTISDTLNSLAESPQHPPLYFLLGRVWVKLWGHSEATLRALSATISLLIFPSLYWLCQELLGLAPNPASHTTTWLAIALVAVSPFHLLYAQEARQYSLWMVLILVASAALLRALRMDGQGDLAPTTPDSQPPSPPTPLPKGEGSNPNSRLPTPDSRLPNSKDPTPNHSQEGNRSFTPPLERGLGGVFPNSKDPTPNHSQEGNWTASPPLERGVFPNSELRTPNSSLFPWLLYALLLAIGFYSFLFMALVAIAHGCFVVRYAFQQSRDRVKILSRYLLASGLATLAFSPWLWVMVDNLNRVTGTASWTSQRFPIYWLVLRWLLYPANFFFDLNLGDRYLTTPALAVMLGLVGLMGYSLYWCCQQVAAPTRWVLITWVAIPALILMIPDVIFGGQRSATARYMIPVYMGLHLMVAWCIGYHIVAAKAIAIQRRWQAGAIALVIIGLVSCAVSSQAELWWTKSPDKHQHSDRILELVNQSEQPLLISDDSTELSDCFACRMLSMSYDLNPTVTLQLVRNGAIPSIDGDYSDIFVFSPDRRLLRRIERRQNHTATLIFEEDNFWFWQLDSSS